MSGLITDISETEGHVNKRFADVWKKSSYQAMSEIYFTVHGYKYWIIANL